MKPTDVIKPMIVIWAVAALLAILVAAVVTGYDWYINPEQVFHNGNTTHWSVTLNTYTSWWLPLWLLFTISLSGLALVVFALRALLRRRKA